MLRARSLPREPFVRLIEANRQDQRVSPLRDLGAAARLLPPVGRPGRRAGARGLRCRRPARGWGSRTRSAPACSSSSTYRTWPRTGPTAASTSRSRTSPASAPARRTSTRRWPGPRCGRWWPSRWRGPAGCCGAGGGWWARCRGGRGFAVAGFIAGGLAALSAIEAAGHDVLGRPAAGRAEALPDARSRARWPGGRAPASDERAVRQLRPLRGDHPRRGRQLLLRHPPAAPAAPAGAVRRLRLRAADRRHRRRRAARRREAAPARAGRGPVAGAGQRRTGRRSGAGRARRRHAPLRDPARSAAAS